MVVDTMVLAYALLGEPEHGPVAVQALEDASRIDVPDVCRAELANVVWQWVRAQRATLAQAHAALDDADALFTRVHAAAGLWHPALELSLHHDHPAYDTLFVALAVALDTQVLTADRRLVALFPGWATPLA